MATSQAALSGSGVAVGSTANANGETVVGFHVMEIKGFSGTTKDLGVGKSIKSSTFNVGGHVWYIECYPYGDDEENAGCVSLFLCLSAPKEQVEAACYFYALVDDHDDDVDDCLGIFTHTYNADTSWRMGIDNPKKRVELESLLKDDCLQLGCEVRIDREFPAVLPLSDLLTVGMPGDLATIQVGGELFTVHRGLQGSSTHVASTVPTMSAENVAGSHVLTIDGYSSAKKIFSPGYYVESECFVVGGRHWRLQLYPNGEKYNDTDRLAVSLYYEESEDEIVKVRFEFTLLTLARGIISSTPYCYAFSGTNDTCCCYFPFTVEPKSSLLLGDSFHVKCDVTIVKEITPMRQPDLHRHFGDLLGSQVGTDVTFDVSGNLFQAHKLVLATRSTAFMAEFFRPGRDNSPTTTRVHIDDMEPGVFKALLHFIYTDTLPEVPDGDDRIVMAQRLLVAADRYAMERLKLICSDMLCSYMNDAPTVIATLELADKHGCRRLKEVCMKLHKGHFKMVTP